jgi:N-acylneuraminate cytidylyltransferase
MESSAITIIPARGGSKGIPGKNLIDFCGKPLLTWSILQAQASQKIDSVYVTSDDEHILEVAVQYGAIPIRRPDELSTDIASSESALMHALDFVEASMVLPDFIVFLQATSPLRSKEDIDGAVRTIVETNADSLFSMVTLDDACLWKYEGKKLKGVTYDPLNRGRRQDRAPIYLENGSIYVFRPQILRNLNNRLGGTISMFEMMYWKKYEIDTFEDIELCAYFFNTYLKKSWEMGE